MDSSVFFSIFTSLCSCHHYPITGHFYHLRKKPCACEKSFILNFFCVYESIRSVYRFFLFWISYSVPYVDKTVLSPLNCLCSFVKIRWLQLRRFVSGLSVLFHWSACLFFCQCHAVLIAIALQQLLKLGGWVIQICPSELLFLDLLSFHINFRIRLSVFTKWLWSCIEPIGQFGQNWHQTISYLILLEHKHLPIYLDLCFLSLGFYPEFCI